MFLSFDRDIAHHAEAYVRRSALFAASSILQALHPSFVASALIEGNEEISNALEWIRIWALQIAESDPDAECSAVSKCTSTLCKLPFLVLMLMSAFYIYISSKICMKAVIYCEAH